MVVAVMTDGVRDGQSGQVRDFARGLRPILVAGDVDAFKGYLGQWDDILGDTTELAGQSDAVVGRTMTQLLRRPRQFGLPDWSDEVPEAPEVSPDDLASDVFPSSERDGSLDIDHRERDSEAAVVVPGGDISADDYRALPAAPDASVDLIGEVLPALGGLPVIGVSLEPGNGASGVVTAIAEGQLFDGAEPKRAAPEAYQVDFVDGEFVGVGRSGMRVVPKSTRVGRRSPPRAEFDGMKQLGLPIGIDDPAGDSTS